MARGKEIDKATVEMVLQMKKRNEKLTTEQIGAVVQCDASTAGRIIKTGSWEGYCAWKAEKAKKEREKNRQPAEEQEEREPEVPGQMQMQLNVVPALKPVEGIHAVMPALKPLEGIQVEIDQAKMMRFLAGQMDRLYMKMETINDTLSQILRVIRKE